MRGRVSRRSLLAGLALAPLAAACDRLPLPLPGREGGVQPPEAAGGGVGIVGTLTDAKALAVNALRLSAAADLLLADAYGALPAERLAQGQVLTVEAAELESGALEARAISLVHPLIGPIDAVGRGRLEILGSEVVLERGLLLADAAGRRFRPKAGQRVAVSGLWRGPEVVASRLDLVEAAEAADEVVAAAMKTGTAPDRPTLGGLELALPAGTALPAVGTFVTARGRREGKSFRVESLRQGRFRGAAGPLRRLSVEGYLDRIPRPPGYVLADLGLGFDAEAALAPFAQDRALYLGPVAEVFAVALGLPLPEGLAARRRLLAKVADGFDPPGAIPTR